MKFLDLNLIPYQAALSQQLEILEKVANKESEETIIFCSHPPVVTLGRSTQAGDVTTWDGELIEIQRGGRATYHGPSQLVIYPILNLVKQGQDLHKYLRTLENIIIAVLSELHLNAVAIKDSTGVWVRGKKVASIGVGVKKWVTYHGIALNVDYDPNAFQGLKPCGFLAETMISLEELMGKKTERKELIKSFENQFRFHFAKSFSTITENASENNSGIRGLR